MIPPYGYGQNSQEVGGENPMPRLSMTRTGPPTEQQLTNFTLQQLGSRTSMSKADDLILKHLINNKIAEKDLGKLLGCGVDLSLFAEYSQDPQLTSTLDKALEECGLSAIVRLKMLKTLKGFDVANENKKLKSEVQRLFRVSDMSVQPLFEWLPCFNLFYDMLFDECPTVGQVKDLVNIVIIITGLMLGSSTALYAAIDFSQMQSAIERFSNVGDISWSFCWDAAGDKLIDLSNLLEPSKSRCASLILNENGSGSSTTYVNRYATDSYWGGAAAVELIEQFGLCANCASGFLGCSLLLGLLIYLFTTNTSFALSSDVAKEDIRLVAAWWPYTKWVALTMVLTLFVGVIAWMRAYTTLLFIKFPSRLFEEYDFWYKRSDAFTTPILSAYNIAMIFVGPIAAISLILLSLGLANKYRCQRLLR